MDNIAHSLTGIALSCVCLRDKKYTKHFGRIVLTGIIATNIPDLDIVNMLKSREYYVEEHRGFTHSFLGALAMIPLSMMAIHLIFRKVCELPLKLLFITSFVLWSVGHILLDVFTLFGIKLLYPFSYVHYDYTLLFIVEPLIWIFGSVMLYYMIRGTKPLVFYAKRYLFAMAVMYITYGGVRLYTVNQFNQEFKGATNISYGVFLNPFFMNYVSAEVKGKGLVQKIFSPKDIFILGRFSANPSYPYIQNHWSENKLPANGEYSAFAKFKFQRYLDFGGNVICKPYGGGAKCYSLKYYFPTYKDSIRNNMSAKIFFFNYE